MSCLFLHYGGLLSQAVLGLPTLVSGQSHEVMNHELTGQVGGCDWLACLWLLRYCRLCLLSSPYCLIVPCELVKDSVHLLFSHRLPVSRIFLCWAECVLRLNSLAQGLHIICVHTSTQGR